MAFSTIKFKIRIKEVLTITFVWVLVAIFISFHDHWAVLAGQEAITKGSYDFVKVFLINLVGALVPGFFGLAVFVFLFKDKQRRKSFSVSLLINTLLIGGLIVVAITFTTFLYKGFSHNEGLFSQKNFQEVAQNFTSYSFLKNITFWFTVSSLTILTLQVRDNYGQGKFWQIVRGKYYQPKEETRIFMFLDIKSSTTIAERIGHIKFFNFVNDFFADITDPIINTQGEIYQYIGDEVIISWHLKQGIHKANCVRCFFEIEEKIQENSRHYYQKYGYVPQFKAGLHYGAVIVGEMGVLKKDLTFAGDVMNTTARIQARCNDYDAKVLISDDLRKILPLPKQYKTNPLGEIELKGKESKVALFNVEKT